MTNMVSGVVVIVTLILGPMTQEQADNVTVALSDGATTATSADGAACDASGLTGGVSFTSTLDTLPVSAGGTGSGAPALAPFDMDVSYHITVTNAAPANIYPIQVSENNLNGSVPGWSALVDGNQNNSATGAFSPFADASNILFGAGTPLCGAGPSGTISVHLPARPLPSATRPFP